MEQITSLSFLLSTAGTTAAAVLITQYTKPLIPESLPVRLYVLIQCLVIQLGLTLILAANAEGLIIAFFNAFIAAAAALGTYEATYNKDGQG